MRDGRNLQRSVKLLFRRFDNLKAKLSSSALYPARPDRMHIVPNGDDMGNFFGVLVDEALSKISEHGIKRLCRDSNIYWRGIEYFMQGRVFERSVEWNTIRAKVRGKSAPYYDVEVVFEQEKGGFSISMSCNCPSARNSICKHVVAVLVAWARKPESFAVSLGDAPERKDFTEMQFQREAHGIFSVVGDLIVSMEESAWKEDFDVVQKVQTLVRQFAQTPDGIQNDHYIKLSHVAIAVCTNILVCLDKKYNLGAMRLYSRASAEVMGKVIESLVNEVHERKGTSMENGKERMQAMKMKQEDIYMVQDQQQKGDLHASGKASRSWDSIVEEFARS